MKFVNIFVIFIVLNTKEVRVTKSVAILKRERVELYSKPRRFQSASKKNSKPGLKKSIFGTAKTIDAKKRAQIKMINSRRAKSERQQKKSKNFNLQSKMRRDYSKGKVRDQKFLKGKNYKASRNTNNSIQSNKKIMKSKAKTKTKHYNKNENYIRSKKAHSKRLNKKGKRKKVKKFRICFKKKKVIRRRKSTTRRPRTTRRTTSTRRPRTTISAKGTSKPKTTTAPGKRIPQTYTDLKSVKIADFFL